MQQQVTYLQDSLPGVQITSPVSGVVVRWRLKSEAAMSQPRVRLRIVRPVMGGYMAVTTDPAAQIVSSAQALNTYNTRLSIQVGDKLGVETLSMLSNLYAFRSAAGGQLDKYPTESGFPDGTTQSNIGGIPYEVLVNADVEPDCDSDGLGDETQDGDLSSCGTKAPTCRGQRLTISGTAGPDSIVGTAGEDVIDAEGANDKVRGLGGNDVICGGAGKDTLKGGPGKDKLYGQGAKDKLVGGGAEDKCVGGKASDKAKGCETVKSI
jgi:Ca2+-binding RTX toxin-like protein